MVRRLLLDYSTFRLRKPPFRSLSLTVNLVSSSLFYHRGVGSSSSLFRDGAKNQIAALNYSALEPLFAVKHFSLQQWSLTFISTFVLLCGY